MKRKRIVVMGFMGACPIAGVVWQHIHYIVGLLRLGHEVYYIEDSARITYNPETWDVGEDFTHAGRVLGKLAEKYGFEGRWAFRARYLDGMPTAGMDSAQIRELYANADATLNICGSQELNEDILRSPLLVYIESDPGVEQIKIDKGIRDTIDHIEAHHKRFTFGENVGTDAFPVPLHGIEWLPTRQPVVTEFWDSGSPPPEDARFTSIANWSTSGKKDIEWNGENYLWSKSKEFISYMELPQHVEDELELATDIPEGETRDSFLNRGWKLSLPHEISADFDAYREFIQRSKGEFTVAKDQYTRLKTGWFSDRSACYLAAGRPVVTQETGFSKHYGGTSGLLAYGTLEEAAECLHAIRKDYPVHAKHARDIAREFFEAEKVMRSLLERCGF